MRILVTGATGFVGGNVAQTLVDKGYQVVALVRKRGGWLPDLNVERIPGDLTICQTLRRVLEQPVDMVVHCAGITSASENSHYYRVNALGTYNLLRALKEASCKPDLFAYVSSLAAAGPGELCEGDEDKPLTPYGESKLYGEYFVRDSGLPYLILRPPVIFGPGDTDVLQFFKMVKKGWLPTFFERKRLSIVYVKNLAAAILYLMESTETGTFFVSDGDYTWWEVAQKAAEIMGVRLRGFPLSQAVFSPFAWVSQLYRCLTGRAVLLNKEKLREMREDAWVCRPSRLEKLGFTPSYTLNAALEETVCWYREQGHIR